MSETHMEGLVGTNPLGFLAAVGIQVAFESKRDQPRLWWSDDVVPHAVTDGNFTIDDIAEEVIKTMSIWGAGPVLNPDSKNGTKAADAGSLKFHQDGIRKYLESSMDDPAANLATSLVAEGGLAKNGNAKPSHLYFTAGQQSFLPIMLKIMENASMDELCIALRGPWEYKSECPSLGWDVVDDANYALSAVEPSSNKKSTNPGSEALAILGLSRYPVFVYRNETVTQGCMGSWKNGTFSWPLWNKPASPMMVKSLLVHAYKPTKDRSSNKLKMPPTPSKLAHAYKPTKDRSYWFHSWGVFRVLRSPIRRTNQGGYGTFGPHEVVWEVR